MPKKYAIANVSRAQIKQNEKEVYNCFRTTTKPLLPYNWRKTY